MHSGFVRIFVICLVFVGAFCQTPYQRAKQLLAKMSQEDKLRMVHGVKGSYVGNVPANEALGIPALHLQDGPQGVGDEVHLVTAWPSALTAVASFDAALMQSYAAGLAAEQRDKGTNIMLGPMVNIARVARGGRNFESFGEDPFLASQMVAASVQGIQSQGIIATVKHFVDNNQEDNRHLVSANVGERTQWEIYYPAFEAAVNAGVGAVMCSYNRINDSYACQNKNTLSDLKDRMGFQGFVMSDWLATHSCIEAANAGLDLEMPLGAWFAGLRAAIDAGLVPQARLDDMVTRILTSMFAAGLFDHPPVGNITANVESPAHAELAYEVAAAGTVLLKNDGQLLPLANRNLKIAVIGDDASASPTISGHGSGYVIPPYVISPLEAMQQRFVTQGNVTLTYANSSSVAAAVANAKAADVALVFVACDSMEGFDRKSLELPNNQDALIAAVVAAQAKTVVVIHSPGAVLMPWEASVPAILEAWLPGQMDGDAITAVLFGDINPSGRLPMTFPLTEDQTPLNTTRQYPGEFGNTYYTEELLVGYRWYDAAGVEPLFPFGHGLSYTTFAYSNLTISGTVSSNVTVSLAVSNTGSRLGKEAVQLYLAFPASAGEPPKGLRGLLSVELDAGVNATVTFVLGARDFSVWDVSRHDWTVVSGSFSALIGASSRDIRLTGSIQV
eukprot:TRINITY_DN8802_c0_g1_i1.p1 TRINITY_DN8802_c0_g1~~TRINITY_DN8802_c0_g1_i1.p1  ORF type:complete len:673 (+),score=239.95 TRINITY_DN8802_c0_g1_i1:161-2179(+)